MTRAFYVNAIVGRGTTLPANLPALFGAPMRAISYRDLSAWGCFVDGEPPAPTPENLIAHEVAAEEIHDLAAALPVRFGTVLSDAEAVRQALVERYATLTADLARIGDKIEMGVTLSSAAGRGEPTEAGDLSHLGPGARYLRGRQRRYGPDSDAVKSAIRAQLGALAIESRCDPAPRSPLVFRGAFLLARADIDRFRGAFRRLRGSRADLRCLLTGPWPPYSFVT